MLAARSRPVLNECSRRAARVAAVMNSKVGGDASVHVKYHGMDRAQASTLLKCPLLAKKNTQEKLKQLCC